MTFLRARPVANPAMTRQRAEPPLLWPSVPTPLATREDLRGVALHLPSFEHGVVAAHIVRCSGDEVLRSQVPQDNVCVRAFGDGALLREVLPDFPPLPATP